MVDELKTLVSGVEDARAAVIDAAMPLTDEQGAFKPAGQWSVAEILEHLYLAEISGVTKIWTACENLRNGIAWDGERPNHGKSIEQVVAETWKPREKAPSVATPHIGGPLRFWLSALPSLRAVLSDLSDELEAQDLQEVVFPHFLSGPLDARQRLDFLRFHLERHRLQIERVRSDPSFPG